MKKKLIYVVPLVDMVEIATEQKILEGSITVTRQSFGTASEDTWGEIE